MTDSPSPKPDATNSFGPVLSELSDAVSSATKQAAHSVSSATQGAFDSLNEEVQSVGKAFGSPHPASPLDKAAKQLDFDMVPSKAPATPATPATPVLPPVSSSSSEPVDYNAFIRDTLLWVNKVRSGVYLVGGLGLLLLLGRLLEAQLPPVTLVCWLLLGQLALNFLRGFISPELQARSTWSDSSWTSGALSGVSTCLKAAAAVHDKHMTGQDAHKTLLLVVLLWGVSLLGRAMSPLGLAGGLWLAAFTLPKAYLSNKAKVDRLAADVYAQVKSQFLKLDPKVRAALVVVPVFTAGYALSATDLGVALLALMVYGRCWLAPGQVDRLNAAVGPAVQRVGKVGSTMGRIVNQAAAKYELTPTPAKAKRA